jgi:hypothetical protein
VATARRTGANELSARSGQSPDRTPNDVWISGRGSPYIAMGDSFSSGPGVKLYFEPNRACHDVLASSPAVSVRHDGP